MVKMAKAIMAAVGHGVLLITCSGRSDMKIRNLLAGLVSATFLWALAPQSANAAAILFGVTGDGGATPETLFTLSQTDASATPFLTLGAGADGESIAFHADNGLMYHMSGGFRDALIFESIDLSGPSVVNIPTTPALVGDGTGGVDFEIGSFTYAGGGSFLMANGDGMLRSITDVGVITARRVLDHTTKGLAFSEGTLYSVDPFSPTLRTLDPATGATLTSTAVTLPGKTLAGATGLATHPDTGDLWAVVRFDFGTERGTERELVTINPMTGVATSIGNTGDRFAGLAFQSVPEATPVPEAGTLLLLGSGIVGMGAAARKRGPRK